MTVNRSAFANAPRRTSIDADALIFAWDPTDVAGSGQGNEPFVVPKSLLDGGGGGGQTVYDSSDYASIQAAIDAANADGGGIVQLGAGDFVTTGLELYPNCWLRGSGVQVTRILHGSSTADAIHVDDARWVQVSDLSIVGTGAAGSGLSSVTCSDVDRGNNGTNRNETVLHLLAA